MALGDVIISKLRNLLGGSSRPIPDDVTTNPKISRVNAAPPAEAKGGLPSVLGDNLNDVSAKTNVELDLPRLTYRATLKIRDAVMETRDILKGFVKTFDPTNVVENFATTSKILQEIDASAFTSKELQQETNEILGQVVSDLGNSLSEQKVSNEVRAEQNEERSDELKEGFDKLDKGNRKIFSKIGGQGLGGRLPGGGGLGRVLPGLLKGAGALAGAFGLATSAAKHWDESAETSANRAVNLFGTAGESILGDVGNKLTSITRGVGEEVLGAFNIDPNAIGEKLGSLTFDLFDSGSPLRQNIDAKLGSVFDFLTDENELPGIIVGKLTDAFDVVSNSIKNVFSAETIEKIKKTAGEVDEKLFGSAREAVTDSLLKWFGPDTSDITKPTVAKRPRTNQEKVSRQNVDKIANATSPTTVQSTTMNTKSSQLVNKTTTVPVARSTPSEVAVVPNPKTNVEIDYERMGKELDKAMSKKKPTKTEVITTQGKPSLNTIPIVNDDVGLNLVNSGIL